MFTLPFRRLVFLTVCCLLQFVSRINSSTINSTDQHIWTGWPDTSIVSEIVALFDHTTGLVFYKDPSVPACFVEDHQSKNSSTSSHLKVLSVSLRPSKSLESKLSPFKDEFCGSLPTYKIEIPGENKLRREKRLLRKRRSTNGGSNQPTYPGSWPGLSQTQIQGSVTGQGFFSGQAQSAHGGYSQTQVQLGGVGIAGNLASSAGNAQAQLSLGTSGGSGQASSFGTGPSTSQVNVNLGQRDQGSMASANVYQQQPPNLQQDSTKSQQAGYTAQNRYTNGQSQPYSQYPYSGHRPQTQSSGKSPNGHHDYRQQGNGGYNGQPSFIPSTEYKQPQSLLPQHTFEQSPPAQQTYRQLPPAVRETVYDQSHQTTLQQPAFSQTHRQGTEGLHSQTHRQGTEGLHSQTHRQGTEGLHSQTHRQGTEGLHSQTHRQGTEGLHSQTHRPGTEPIHSQILPHGVQPQQPGTQDTHGIQTGGDPQSGLHQPVYAHQQPQTGLGQTPFLPARSPQQLPTFSQTPLSTSNGANGGGKYSSQPAIGQSYPANRENGKYSQSQGIYVNGREANSYRVNGDNQRRNGNGASGNGFRQYSVDENGRKYSESSGTNGGKPGVYASAVGGQAQAQSLYLGGYLSGSSPHTASYPYAHGPESAGVPLKKQNGLQRGSMPTSDNVYHPATQQQPAMTTIQQQPPPSSYIPVAVGGAGNGHRLPSTAAETHHVTRSPVYSRANGNGQSTQVGGGPIQNGKTNGHAQNGQTNGHAQNGQTIGHAQNGQTNGHAQNGQTIGHAQNGHYSHGQNIHTNGHGKTYVNGYSQNGFSNGRGQSGHIQGVDHSALNGYVHGQTQNGNGQRKNGNGHGVIDSNGSTHKTTNGYRTTPSQVYYRPVTNGNGGTSSHAVHASSPQTGFQSQQQPPSCTVITFTCTIVIESNGRAKLCRPKTTNPTSTGSGTNEQGICCC